MKSPALASSLIAALAVVGLAAGCASTEKKGGQVVQAPDRPEVPPPDQKTQFVEHTPFQKTAPLQTIVLADPVQPIVSIRVVFKTGSVDDPKGKEGLTALTAAVLEEGGTKTLSSSELLEALFPMAAELGISVDKQLTTYTGRVHKDHLARFLEIFSEVLLAPRFDPKELERLRADAISRIRTSLRNDDIEQLGKVGLDALLYPDHPLGHFVGGTVTGLQAITLEDVQRHARQVFTQERAIVGLAGPVDDALKEKILARLKALPAEGAKVKTLPRVPVKSGHALLLTGDFGSTAVSMGYPWALRRGDRDFFAVAFALSYLGEHRQFNGVLFNELREQRGLNYGTYAYAEHFAQEGWSTLPRTQVGRTPQTTTLWIRPVVPDKALFATRGTLYFLHRLVEEGIPKERFELTRSFLSGYTRLWEQTDQRRLGYALDGLLHGTPDFLESYRRAMKTMTPESVHAAVRRHLSVEKMNLVFVTRDAEAIRGALASGAPSPITYETPKPEALLEEDKKIVAFPLPVKTDRIEIQPAAGFME